MNNEELLMCLVLSERWEIGIENDNLSLSVPYYHDFIS